MSEIQTEKKRGRTKRTPEECHEAFNAFTEAMGIENLKLKVDGRGSCKIIKTVDNTFEDIDQIAGNTLVQSCEFAMQMIQQRAS